MTHDGRDPLDLSLAELSRGLAGGALTSSAVTAATLARLEATRHLNTFITVDAAGATAAAAESDARRARGEARSALDGIPLALKDSLITRGVRTTAASRMLADYVPPYEGAMAERLRAAGAVLIGKTNLDEFAMGSSSERSAFGPVRNPWAPERIPGGSSGGSAAAVAARQVFGALGTDTGGSIRQPAAMCGIYGLKPTYGRVSRHGVIAFASSLDQVGPFGRTARDVAMLLQAIAGFDPGDSTSADVPVPDYVAALDRGVAGMRVGVPREYFVEGMDPEVERAVRAGLSHLEAAGATLVPVDLPHTRYALATYYVICTAEASSNLARYDGVRYGARAQRKDLRQMYAATRAEGFGPEVRRRIILGTYVLSAGYYDAYYGRAQRVRTLIRRDFEAAFAHVDALATPTSPVTAFPLGARLEDPLSMYLADVFTLAVNLAGLPAMNVPAGFSADGLPIGLQLIAPWFEEGRLFAAGQALEARTALLERRPPL
jgi:aspartyl-tRNA(Asn)/glutamyl-tRNA(Gln) amidotransferase subunit A